mmetsp:Transcript_13072/g.9112  ORF Transcript_13072/g.9112 Transcript_13072/m.9112 type:complete len:299 (+) Transcript_13072:1083-1979(+)
MTDKVVTMDLLIEIKRILSAMITGTVIVQESKTSTVRDIRTTPTTMVVGVIITIAGRLKLTILALRIITETTTTIMQMSTTGTTQETLKALEMTEAETMIININIKTTTDKTEAITTKTLRKSVIDLIATTITIDPEMIKVPETFLGLGIDLRIRTRTRIVMIREIVVTKISSTGVTTIEIITIRGNLIATETLIKIIIVVSRTETSLMLAVHNDRHRQLALVEMITKVRKINLLISLSSLTIPLELLSSITMMVVKVILKKTHVKITRVNTRHPAVSVLKGKREIELNEPTTKTTTN